MLLFRNLVDKAVLEHSSSFLKIYDDMSSSVGLLIAESFYFTVISCLQMIIHLLIWIFCRYSDNYGCQVFCHIFKDTGIQQQEQNTGLPVFYKA